MEKLNLIFRDLNIMPIEGKTGREFSTFKIGGVLKNLVLIDDQEKLKKLLKKLSQENISYFMLGNGSNVLFKDNENEHVVIKLSKEFSYINKISDYHYECGASILMPQISNYFLENELSGFEYSCSLPATIGGCIKMDASFKGQKTSDILDSVIICNEDGEIEEIKKENLIISKKNVDFGKSGMVIGAKFLLKKEKKDIIKAKIDENILFRKNTQPASYPSAGCIFKNPQIDLGAGLLLDKCGLKGEIRGGAMYSTMHANWIVNYNKNAKADDVIYLIEKGKEKVQKEFNITLEEEIIML